MIRKIVIGTIISVLSIFILALFTNSIMLWNIHTEKVMGTIESWIGFYATIIGGLITFLGVLLTIHINKKENEKQYKKEKLKEEKIINLNKIKFLWEIEINLNSVKVDLKNLNEYIDLKIKTLNNHEYALLVNEKLTKQFYNKNLKPTKKEIIFTSQEVSVQYIATKFDEIKIQLEKLKNTYDNKNLQVKSAEVDWRIYEFIIDITRELYKICDTQKAVSGSESNQLDLFIIESKLIIEKINGSNGINNKILGIKHIIKEKRKQIENEYFMEKKK